MPTITIAIDPEDCIAAANCAGVAPKFFRIADHAYAEVLDRDGRPQGTVHTLDVSDEELALIREAAESCPTRAIIVDHAA
jgi:ferredoxin